MGEIKISNTEELYTAIAGVLKEARSHITHAVNSVIVNAYWYIGKYLIEFEQNGRERAKYGDSTINELSSKLQTEFGSGFTPTNLRYMRQFYQLFPNYHTVCDKLSWSHYRTLLKIDNEQVRFFYMHECISANWTVRQLERQINTRFYERLIASKDKEAVRNEISVHATELTPKEIIRDPYILEFLQIPQSEHFLESDLERMLISKLQHFLLELGKGFSFVARQKRISFDDKHFYIDLVFYNYLARCFVLIDLKTDELTHQDLGQMQMYVNYYTRELMNQGDNPPIGIVLCANKNDSVVKYTLPEGQTQIFASKYMTYMPSEAELKECIENRK